MVINEACGACLVAYRATCSCSVINKTEALGHKIYHPIVTFFSGDIKYCAIMLLIYRYLQEIATLNFFVVYFVGFFVLCCVLPFAFLSSYLAFLTLGCKMWVKFARTEQHIKYCCVRSILCYKIFLIQK